MSAFDDCIVCKQKVRPRQEAIQCDGCSLWNHRTCSTGISHQEYWTAVREDKDIEWRCPLCPLLESTRLEEDVTRIYPNLSLRPILCSKLHTTAAQPATFSITRALWGKTPAEIEEEKGIPEPPRETIFHCIRDVKGSPTKFNMVAKQIRGLQIEEAIKQMSFSPKRPAVIIRKVIQEAQAIAQENHGIEDKTHLWVASSYASKGRYIKKIRYHGRGRAGIMHKKYCHYYVVLREGTARPKHKKRMKKHLSELQQVQRHPRHIRNSLSWW